MKCVVIESPFSGDVERNRAYAFNCMRDSLSRGEAPIASHLLYTQFLNDAIPEERELGIQAGFAWNKHAVLVAVYTDYGISRGMQYGIENAMANSTPIEYRMLP